MIRAVFVHPAQARRGLGRRLMRWLEEDAAAAGITGLVLAATLTAAPLYRSLGFEDRGDATARLPGGVSFPLIEMAKRLAAPLRLAA